MMQAEFIQVFLISFGISMLGTPLAKRLAYKVGAVDKPEARKVHSKPIPRLGGLAIMAGVLVPLLVYLDKSRPLVGLLVGLITLLVLGIVDDIKGLDAKAKLFWQFIAAIVVLAGGIGIVYITNPLGGVINLDGWQIAVEVGVVKFNILPFANLVSVIWIMGMINAVNLLDGLDGLAGGVAAIAALVLFMFAITPGTANYTVAILSIALLGALVGFLPFNFHPSSIFMGDSGAYTVGLLLAILSIYSGSKIAIGAMVLGFAVIDMFWAVSRRIYRRQSLFRPDRGHFHHVLLDSGFFTHRRAVIFIYILTTLVAVTLLVAGGLAAFVLLILLLILVSSFLRILSPFRKRRL